VRPTKLILTEGIPGSGKSTMGQFLESAITTRGTRVIWWYEEQKGHPLYVFDDDESIPQVVDDLFSGRHQRVIDAVVDRWRLFAAQVEAADDVVILDSCLYGFLTWTLFPADVPTSVIEAYVDAVEGILRPVEPSLIYFYHDDVARTLSRVRLARGRDWSVASIERDANTPYAKRLGLSGVDGFHAYWRAYQAFSSRLFEHSALAKIKVEASAGDWDRYRSEVVRFLELSPVDGARPRSDDLQQYVGIYQGQSSEGTTITVEISDHEGQLFASGLPHLWPRNQLVAVSVDTFRVASFPCELRFERDAAGRIERVASRGRELMSGSLDLVLVRSDIAPG
jgi:thymidylate kinase